MYARMCKHTGTAARSSLGHWQLMSQRMAPAQAPMIERVTARQNRNRYSHNGEVVSF